MDIAIDAGMRPMLKRQGFRRKTKRYFLRETPQMTQFAAMYPDSYEVGYVNCFFSDCAGILLKELLNLAEELDLGPLYTHVRHSDHECHITCGLWDWYSFHAKIDFSTRRKNSPFFIRPFLKFPEFEEYIPELKEFRKLCKRLQSSPPQSDRRQLIEEYGLRCAEQFEKYIVPWFDLCEDINFAVRWMEHWEGKSSNPGNLLLAATYCVAGETEKAKPHVKNAIVGAKKPLQEIYKEELRNENKLKRLKRQKNRENKALEIANKIQLLRQVNARHAQALCEHFRLNVD